VYIYYSSTPYCTWNLVIFGISTYTLDSWYDHVIEYIHSYVDTLFLYQRYSHVQHVLDVWMGILLTIPIVS